MRIFLLVCSLLYCSSQIFSQNAPVRILGIEQGLSNNAVTSIYQDKNGFMWFGTYDGLNRYDGYGFKVFRNRIGDSSSLIYNTVYTIEGDQRHNLWVGGQKGACIYNAIRSDFQPLYYHPLNAKKSAVLKDAVYVIKAINRGAMLVGTQHNGLLLFDSSSITGLSIALPGPVAKKDYNVSAIEYDSATQTCWVFAQQAGLYKYDPETKTLLLVQSSIKQANNLKMSGNGSLWLGSDEGLFKYSTVHNTYSSGFLSQRQKLVNLHIDRDGVLWIASDGGGVFTLVSGAVKATPYLSKQGNALVNSNAVYSIYEDKEGRRWFGTLRGGVNMVDSWTPPFKHIRQQSTAATNPARDFILAFCEDRRNNVWIGTDGAGLRYWDRAKNSFIDFEHRAGDKNAISSNFVTNLIEDAKGDIWISTWFGGINRFNWSSRTFEHFSCFNSSLNVVENNTWIIYEDRLQRIWASATNDGSLYLFNRSLNKFELFDPSIVDLQCLAEDNNGVLWGGNYSSLIRIDPSRKQHQVFQLGTTIRSIHEDKNGNFWLGTQGNGLLRFDPKTGEAKKFTTDHGLPSNTILRMLEDKSGNLWLSTFNGLCQFDPKKEICLNFSQSDGLQSNQFSFNAGLSLRSGEFLFGGIDGFNIFYPDSVKNSGNERKVFLTGLRINNTAIEKDDRYVVARDLDKISAITLPYDRAVVSMDFVALDYSGADKIMYAYFLEGWDKVWNYSNNIRTANYTRLQEGNYKFRVKVSQADGKWREETSLLSITVLPPWYRTWWAYLLYFCTAATIIYVYVSYTKRQERLRYEVKFAHLENEKEKEINERKLDFFTNISHEFRTPLTLIINPLKNLVAREADNNKEATELNVVYRNARRLLSLVDQLLLFRKADSGTDVFTVAALNIVELVKDVYACFGQHAAARNIDYSLIESVTAGSEMIVVDREKIEIALFNLLSNAFKFTPAGGKIVVQVKTTETAVGISVTDSGSGISPKDLDRIFIKFQQAALQKKDHKSGFGIGLFLVKHFVEGHGGRIRYSSPENGGSSFEIELLKGAEQLAGNGLQPDQTKHSELLDELAEGSLDESRKSDNGTEFKEGRKVEEVVTSQKSLLLIDDNDEIREYLRHVFMEKFLVYAASNGTEGFRLANEKIPDLIISDVNMEGMNGVELCAAIKQSDVLGHIPVILLTGETGNDIHKKGIEGGADDYITKPFDIELLTAKVETILKNRNLLQRYFFDNITLKETSVKVPAEYQEFLRKCIEVVEENIDKEDFTMKKFSQAMGMSHSGLYQKVKSISGQSLNAFIRSIRLRRAAVLMLAENMNINQAAFQVGIADVRYFREQFVKLFGMIPSEYIRRYRDSFQRDFNTIKSSDQKSGRSRSIL